MQRRQFLHTSAAALAGSGCARSANSIEQVVAQVGRLPRHKLPRCGREISVIVGAGTWSAEAIEAGIRCGVNFWHKSDDWWSRTTPPAILKNRDAHYCQVAVDRVHGNHETGRIDEEAHYRFVKEAAQRSGLGYFDDMQFHFGYHNVAELKKNRAMIRAYERLKKEGLVKHLCLSQHNYNGNARVKNGQSAAEILASVMDEGLYEHAQFFYSFGEGAEISRVVSLAKSKGFGTVAMKTARGAWRMQQDRAFMRQFPAGTSTHHALARWLTTGTDLTAAVIQINGLDEFADTCSGAGKPLRASDARAMEMMTAYAAGRVCGLCNTCMAHCPRHVPIADILRYERYAVDYRDCPGARRLYAQLEVNARDCAACGQCTGHCPQRMPIPDRLAAAHALLA
jgi:predicted aldo/keto reductase-like oxidoreductase